jgi:large subunit ribosomal protein L27
MGRDHTIYATESGYVKYYKDPERHPKRQYIGVVFERSQVLPLPRNAMRRRRLGMVAQKMELFSETAPSPISFKAEAVETLEAGEVADAAATLNVKVKGPSPKIKERKGEEGRDLTLRPGYMYREANWQIGRAAERAGIQVRKFKPRDRWTAWKKTEARKAKNVERRGLNRKIKK